MNRQVSKATSESDKCQVSSLRHAIYIFGLIVFWDYYSLFTLVCRRGWTI
jgi:hypothetical protein